MRLRVWCGFMALFATITFGHLASGSTFTVNCNARQTIKNALKKAKDGDTIIARGTCRETVSITRRGLTLSGVAGAIIDGSGSTEAVITVDGAQGVTIKDVTVQNGRIGILVRGSSGFIERVTAQLNTLANIQIIAGSCVQLTDCTVLDGGGDGIQVAGTSSVGLVGITTAKNNEASGIQVTLSSSLIGYPGGSLVTSENHAKGIIIGDSSSAIFDGIAITASYNGEWGVQVDRNSSLLVKGTGSILSRNNATDGIGLFGGGYLQITQNGSLQAFDNANLGINLGNGKLSTLDSGYLTVTGNPGGGIGAVGGSGLSLENGGSTISGGLVLRVLSCAILKGNVIDTITSTTGSFYEVIFP
jgi:hypothetical protein